MSLESREAAFRDLQFSKNCPPWWFSSFFPLYQPHARKFHLFSGSFNVTVDEQQSYISTINYPVADKNLVSGMDILRGIACLEVSSSVGLSAD